jgi:hypothetical protein
MASRVERGRRVDPKRAKRRPQRRPAAKRSAARRTEKRKTVRIQPFVAPCRVSAGSRTLTGYLTDLSATGARISSDDPLPATARAVVIEVRLLGAMHASRLPARIRWRKAGRRKAGEAALFGITFAGLARAQQALLRSVVEEFRRRAALVA